MCGTLEELERIIGKDAAEKLVANLPGTSFYVPTCFREDHAVVKLIGKQASSLLSQHMAGETVLVPMGKDRTREKRNARIQAAFAAGRTTKSIALDEGITQRAVRYIIKA